MSDGGSNVHLASNPEEFSHLFKTEHFLFSDEISSLVFTTKMCTQVCFNTFVSTFLIVLLYTALECGDKSFSC